MPGPGPEPSLCRPQGPVPPNIQLNMNLPNGDLLNREGKPEGDSLGPPGTFNVTECYARCLAHNAAVSGGPTCDAWTATAHRAGRPSEGPWCWLKSHHSKAHGGFQHKPTACYVSAECRVDVPAAEFPCASAW